MAPGRTPWLVGRDAEAALLVDVMTRDATAVVSGEAGIGKSALVTAAAAACGRELLRGGGYATLATIPYLPFRLALDSPVDGDAVQVAHRVEAAVRDAVLAVEDLQWVDPDTLAVLPLLVGRVALVVTARPGAPALDGLNGPGIEAIRLGPLDDDAAARIVRRERPGIGEAEARRVIRRGSGNPLVLEELARDGRESPTVARAIVALVDGATPEARRSLQSLAVAGRPLPAAPFSAVLDELAGLGLVTVAGVTVAVRHALIAEALADGLPPAERMATHARVADLATDPVDRAVHLARAGRATEAIALADRVLETTGDLRRRLALLRLAAGCATGPGALARRLAAARAATDLDEPSVVIELLDAPGPGEPGLLAIADGLLARACSQLGRHADAEVAVERGLRLQGHDATGEAAHRLAMEQATTRAIDGDLAGAVSILDGAEGAGADAALRHRRAHLRSFLRFLQGEPVDIDGMVAALDDAIRDRNAGVAVSTGINTHSILLARDGPAAALDFARRTTDRLEAAGIEAWRLRTETVQTLAFRGAAAEAVVLADELLEQPLPVDDLPWTLVLRAEALVHLGRFREAAASLERAEPMLSDVWGHRGEALTTASSAALWSGRPRDALATATRALAVPTHYAANHVLAALHRAWAQAELHRLPDPVPDVQGSWLADGARAEWAALRARVRGQPAREAFGLAAGAWDGRLAFRATLCRWAAADGARLDGSPGAADLLQAVLAEAEGLGYEPIARRARRSLRLAGVRVARVTPVSPGTSLLTAREHEVLDLVGDGLSNIEIARRMGLGRPTVARILSNAMAKLGADTRAQAVAIAQAHAA